MAEPAPSDNVFFSDLPGEVDQATLEGIFGAYGSIKQARLLPGATGKNAALIRFQTVEEASWVVENLNGNIPQGLTTPVMCRFANPPGAGKGAQGGGGGGGGGGEWTPFGGKGKGGDRWSPYDGKGGGKSGDKGKGGKGGSIKTLKKGLQYAGVLPGGKWTNDENALFVGGLPADTTDCDLYEIFSPFGSIPFSGVRAMKNEDGSCRGIGFVNFLDSIAAQTAIATLNGTMLPDGSTMKVCEKGPSKPKGGK